MEQKNKSVIGLMKDELGENITKLRLSHRDQKHIAV